LEILVPDIGDFEDVEVIEVLVKPGDRVNPEDPLITLESDKATMDIPAPEAGEIAEIRVSVGDKVSQGSVIAVMSADGDATLPEEPDAPSPKAVPAPSGEIDVKGEAVRVPDIGDFDSVEVIEVLVNPGDQVNAEDPLITLESDKATMDIPAPFAGTVAEMLVSVGDRVSENSAIALIRSGTVEPAAAQAPKPEAARPQSLSDKALDDGGHQRGHQNGQVDDERRVGARPERLAP